MAEVTASPSFTGNGANELLQVRNLGKLYGGRGSVTTALDGLSFSVDRGEFVGIMGPSGSGKTTLLNCIATIDTPTTGHILLNGSDISDLKGRKLSDFRRDQLGFVFQDANLLDTLTGFENIALALTIKGERASKVEPKVEKVARKAFCIVFAVFPREDFLREVLHLAVYAAFHRQAGDNMNIGSAFLLRLRDDFADFKHIKTIAETRRLRPFRKL
jgi:ABC-type glutathione transport system ATPase component